MASSTRFFPCIILVILFGLAVPSDGQGNNGNNSLHAPSRAEVAHAIDLATGYLERACGPDGKFAYKVEIGSGNESSSYDIVRHEGAIYALAMANRYKPDPKIVETMVRAAGFLRKNYIYSGPHPGQLAVWSRPVSKSPERQYATLGGAGLGLVALAAVREVEPDAVSLADLQGLGWFVLFLQKEDGSFVYSYSAQNGPVTNWESLYYPGEAALGLIALYEADHSSQWLVAAAKTLGYLARERAGLTDVSPDHWALIATAKLIPYSDQVRSTVSRDELVRHAEQICESILHDQFHSSSAAGLDGAFDASGRTAPAATRLEGLLAAMEFLPKDDSRARIESAIDRGIAFLMRAQLSSGPEQGGIPGAIGNRAADRFAIRIDYVQHALCAFLRYEQLYGLTKRAGIITDHHSGHIRLLFGGDTDFGESYQEEYARKGGVNILVEKGYEYGIEKLAPLLQAVDYRVLNLETPLTLHRDSPLTGKEYLHYSDPVKAPATLGRFGPIAYSLANNHTLDQGEAGLDDTLTSLTKAGAGYFGAGKNLADAERPLVQKFQIGDKPFAVAVLGGLEYSRKYEEQFHFYATGNHSGVAAIDPLSVENAIRDLRRENPDVYIIYFMHGLANYQWKTSNQVATVRTLRNAGVDLVIGSGSHMMQEVEREGNAWVFYGIGNFLFNASGRYAEYHAPPYSLVIVLDFHLEDGRLQASLRAYPILSDNKLTNYRPRFPAESELREVEKLLAEKGHWNAEDRRAVKNGSDSSGCFIDFAHFQ